MNKNKLGQETKWSLWKIQPDKNYDSILYVWADEENRIKFVRSIEGIGFMPYPFNITIEENEPVSNLKKYFGKNVHKVSNHRMNDEMMAKGWLVW